MQYLKISFGSATFALTISILYYFSRLGFHQPISEIARTLGICFFILFFSDLINLIHNRTRQSAQPLNPIVWSLIAVLIITCSGYFLEGHSANIFVFLGYAFLIVCLIKAFQLEFRRRDMIHVLGIIIFAIGVFATATEWRSLPPLFVEMLALQEYSTEDMNAGIDTLYHLSIAQMIKTYGIASLGIDKLIPIKYHYGSHWVFAQFSKALAFPMIKIYLLVYPVVFFSLFTKSFLVLITQVRVFFLTRLVSPVILWIGVMIGFFGFLPINFKSFLLERAGMSLTGVWVSESYHLSLILLIGILSLGIDLSQKNVVELSLKKTNWTTLGLLCVLILLSGVIKVSTMAVLLVAATYLFWRLAYYQRAAFWALLIIVWTAGVWIVFSFGGNGDESGSQIALFHTYREFIQTNFVVFIVLYYSLLALLILHEVLTHKPTSLAKWKELYKGKNILYLEVLAVVALVGFIPGALVKISGGSGLYFSEIQYWCCLFVFLGLLPGQYDKLMTWISARVRMRAGWIRLSVISTLAAIAVYNVMLKVALNVDSNVHTRASIVKYPEKITKGKTDKERFRKIRHTTPSEISAGFELFTSQLQARLDTIPHFNLLSQIQQLDTLTNKRNYVLHTNDYSLFSEFLPCWKYPFVFPTFAGIATLEGFDTKGCAWVKSYGYNFSDYPETERNFYSNLEQSSCEKITGSSFRGIIHYDLTRQTYVVENCNITGVADAHLAK